MTVFGGRIGDMVRMISDDNARRQRCFTIRQICAGASKIREKRRAPDGRPSYEPRFVPDQFAAGAAPRQLAGRYLFSIDEAEQDQASGSELLAPAVGSST